MRDTALRLTVHHALEDLTDAREPGGHHQIAGEHAATGINQGVLSQTQRPALGDDRTALVVRV